MQGKQRFSDLQNRFQKLKRVENKGMFTKLRDLQNSRCTPE